MNTFIINTSTSRWDFDYYLEEDCIEKGRHLEKYFTLTTFNPELKSFMDEYIDAVETDLDKGRIKVQMRELMTQAQAQELV